VVHVKRACKGVWNTPYEIPKKESEGLSKKSIWTAPSFKIAVGWVIVRE
jgi:hypothetical protein